MKLYPLFYHDRTNFPKNWEKLQSNQQLNPLVKPISVTTCLMLDDKKNVVSIGIAIQNAIDGENRKTANKQAKKRAIDAIRAKRNILPVGRDYVVLLFSAIKLSPTPSYKGTYNPPESEYERFKNIINKKVLSEKESIDVN